MTKKLKQLKLKNRSPSCFDSDLSAVAKSTGDFIEYWGFRNIHGRIWVVIYLSPTPVSTPEIIERLGISKGLASRSIGELIKFNLISEAEKSSHGRHTYLANEDVGSVVYDVLKNREMALLDQSLKNLSQLAMHSEKNLKENGVSPGKLKQLTQLTSENKGLLASFLKKKFRSFPEWIKFSRLARGFLKLGT